MSLGEVIVGIVYLDFDFGGLTTGQAAFIEEAKHHDQLFIHQPYELYSCSNHETWRRLYSRLGSRWNRYANEAFLRGIDSLCLSPTRVPRLDDVNRFLCPLTGFQAQAVSGYVPALPVPRLPAPAQVS